MSTPANGADSEGVGSIDIGPGTIDPREFRPSAFAGEREFYVGVLVIESTSEAADYAPLYEESFVLIKAESQQEAREKAIEYGKQHETSYLDEEHRLITWKLKRLVEVKQLEDATFDDGTELYSRFFRDYSGYESFEPLIDNDDEP
jgi:hypothetical protein